MADQPLVAVVVPVYGVEQFVVAALESVLAQTYRNWECIVVDDGSKDASVERARPVIDGDDRFRLIRQENRGLAGARNTGLAHLSPEAEFVAFLDSDDTWVPTALATLVAALQADPAAAGGYGYAELMDAEGTPIRPGHHSGRQRDRRAIDGWRLRTLAPEEPMTFEGAVVVGGLWPPAVGLHRRSAVDRAGLFDTTLGQIEDWDYYQRTARYGHYVVVQEQVAWYRSHGAQMTTNTGEASYFYEIVRRKVWADPANTPEQKRAATRAWRQIQFRQTGRCAQRTVRAIREGRWSEVPTLAAGTLMLGVQNFGVGPPRISRRQIRWTQVAG